MKWTDFFKPPPTSQCVVKKVISFIHLQIQILIHMKQILKQEMGKAQVPLQLGNSSRLWILKYPAESECISIFSCRYVDIFKRNSKMYGSVSGQGCKIGIILIQHKPFFPMFSPLLSFHKEPEIIKIDKIIRVFPTHSLSTLWLYYSSLSCS